jgi:hypothetical protein
MKFEFHPPFAQLLQKHKHVFQVTEKERRQAIDRGLDFVYRTACDPENFEMYGHDFLGCFSCIESTSKDLILRRTARSMGRERARYWRREHAQLPIDLDVDSMANLVMGSDAADRLGVCDGAFKKILQKAATRFSVQDYLGFDPAHEPPSDNVPDECVCGIYNKRGRKTCRDCRKRLTMLSPYAVWLDALIRTYISEHSGISLGASYADVLKWLPTMRPYPEYDEDNPDFYWAIYAVTHVVYTLNDYSLYRLSPGWLPHECAFLKRNLRHAIAMEDPETMGEFLDALKSFGLPENHRLIRQGIHFLLTQQNADGSWGDVEAEDIYGRYHPTWTAIDGLREYMDREERLSFPSISPLLKQWA